MGKYQEIWKIFHYIYKTPKNPQKPRYLAMITLKCRLFLLYIPHSPINICTSLEIPQKTLQPQTTPPRNPFGGLRTNQTASADLPKPLPRTDPRASGVSIQYKSLYV